MNVTFIRVEFDDYVDASEMTITTTSSNTYEVYEDKDYEIDKYEKEQDARLAEEEKMNCRIGWFMSNKDVRINPNHKNNRNTVIRNNLPRKIRTEADN